MVAPSVLDKVIAISDRQMLTAKCTTTLWEAYLPGVLIYMANYWKDSKREENPEPYRFLIRLGTGPISGSLRRTRLLVDFQDCVAETTSVICVHSKDSCLKGPQQHDCQEESLEIDETSVAFVIIFSSLEEQNSPEITCYSNRSSVPDVFARNYSNCRKRK